MEVLRVLEEKISVLVNVMQDLKAKNEALKLDNEKVKTECQKLHKENARLHDEHAQLLVKMNVVEKSVHKGNERIEETKVVVDDLIRSIDALVHSEQQ